MSDPKDSASVIPETQGKTMPPSGGKREQDKDKENPIKKGEKEKGREGPDCGGEARRSFDVDEPKCGGTEHAHETSA